MSEPTSHDREQALVWATDMKDRLWLITQTLRRTSGHYTDPLDPKHKRKRELRAEDWAEVAVWAEGMHNDLKRLLGTAHELGR